MTSPQSVRRVALIMMVSVPASLLADENSSSQSLADLVKQQFPTLEESPAAIIAEQARKKESAPAPPPEPLPEAASIELPDTDKGAPQHVIKSGDTLGKISALRYESPAYAPLIKVFNNADERRLKVGQVIKTPSIATIVREAGSHVLVRFPDEIRALLDLREEFLAIEPAVSSGASAGVLADELKPKLQAMRKKIEVASYGLEQRKHGVTGMPNSTLSQLRSVSLNLRSLERADFGKEASRPGRIHTHLGLALTYAILWGQNGFK